MMTSAYIAALETIDMTDCDRNGPEINIESINRNIDFSTARLTNRQHNELDVPVWVYHRGSSEKPVDETCDSRTRPSSRQPESQQPPLLPAPEISVSEHLAFELKRLGYAHIDIDCDCDDQTLTLRGTVTRFYFVQIAIAAARLIANGRRIEVRIEVEHLKHGISCVG